MRPVECSLGVSFRLCHADLLQRPLRLAQLAGGSLTLAVDGLELEFGDVAVQEHDALSGMPDFRRLFLHSAKPAELHVWAFDLGRYMARISGSGRREPVRGACRPL
jgi:hypothetical protein